MAENCDFEQSIYKDCQYQLCEIDWRGIWKYKLLNHKQETKVLSHFGMSLFVFKAEGSDLSILPFKNNNFVLRMAYNEGLEFHNILFQQLESIILQNFVKCLYFSWIDSNISNYFIDITLRG